MNIFYKIYVNAGRLGYPLQLPLMRIFMRRTSRAYVLIFCGNKILLIKNWLSRPDWHLPGGGIGRGETPEQAVAREAGEEVGIKLKPEELKLVSKGRWQTDKLGHRYFIFKASVKRKPEVKRRRFEIIDYAWLPIAGINAAQVSPEIIDAITRAGLKADI